MKYIYFYFLVVLLVLNSCGSKEENTLIFKYALETNKTEKYVLNTKKNDSVVHFEYRNLNDTIPLFNFNYFSDKEQLVIKSKTFLYTKENYNLDGFKFKIFRIKEPNTGIRNLIFNENYGLLASVAFGENFIFSKDAITPKIKELTFKKIFRSINNLKIITKKE